MREGMATHLNDLCYWRDHIAVTGLLIVEDQHPVQSISTIKRSPHCVLLAHT